jgi:hypothetical protein
MSVAPWTCPTCDSTVVSTPFCPECGERRIASGDLTWRGLIRQAAEALSNIDGKLIRSLRALVNRPGALTASYVAGERQRYIKPFALFLVANGLFFAVQSATNERIFSTTLLAHMHGQDWSDVAQRLVASRLESLGTTLERYAPLFDQAVALNAKSLIIIMVLPFTLALAGVFHRTRLPYAAHLAFALHLYAFLLLLFCADLGIAAVSVLLGGGGLASAGMDNFLSVINVIACGTYLYLAMGPVYSFRGKPAILKTVLLTTVVAVLVLGYRFLLLPITLYTTQ